MNRNFGRFCSVFLPGIAGRQGVSLSDDGIGREEDRDDGVVIEDESCPVPLAWRVVSVVGLVLLGCLAVRSDVKVGRVRRLAR